MEWKVALLTIGLLVELWQVLVLEILVKKDGEFAAFARATTLCSKTKKVDVLWSKPGDTCKEDEVNASNQAS